MFKFADDAVLSGGFFALLERFGENFGIPTIILIHPSSKFPGGMTIFSWFSWRMGKIMIRSSLADGDVAVPVVIIPQLFWNMDHDVGKLNDGCGVFGKRDGWPR